MSGRTGVPRKTKQPLDIDRLPDSVRGAILFLRNKKGKTWKEIEALSAEPFNKGKGPGFVDWENVPKDVARKFPGRKITDSKLQRWWDLRVDQVSANVERMAIQAREISAVFSKAVSGDDKNAVIGATRDILLGILAEDGSVRGRAGVAQGLIALAGVMEQGVANEIRKRVVDQNERKLKALEAREAAAKAKLDAELARLSKKGTKKPITQAELDAVYERTFGPRPVPSKSQAAA
jgi:hypothetical protein